MSVDSCYSDSDLHQRLYANPSDHPGDVYYLLVCRVARGHHVRTVKTGRNACSVDDGTPLFPVSFREVWPPPTEA